MSPRTLHRLVGAALGLIFLVYFLQTLTAPPNSDDGGVTLGYIQRIARGERVHFDFLDYYGPLAYRLAAAAYRLAGEQAVGVGVWMILLKVLTLGAVHHSTSSLSTRFHGLLAAVVTGVLLGLPWPMFQIPYAHHLTLPLVLLTASWVLSATEPLSPRRLIAAAVATAAMLWIKVTVGAFVAAAVIFYLLYWLPGARAREEGAPPSRAAGWRFRGTQLVGLVLYGVVFQLFLREHFDRTYLAYLTGPLAIAIAVTAVEVVSGLRAGRTFGHHAHACALYVGATVVSWTAVLLACIGPHEAGRYAREQVMILRAMRSVGQFPPVGAHGLFRGYAEYYWPQLPWLFTALYVVWLVGEARGAAERAFGGEIRRARARVTGVFVLGTMHTFVIYSVPDDAHIMQALLLVTPLLFVLLFHVERLVTHTPTGARRLRGGVAAVSLLYASTLVFPPEEGALRWGPGDWGSPHLAHLRYHPEWSRFANPVDPTLSDRVLDRDLDRAAQQIDAVAADGEEILVLAPMHLLYVASNTLPTPRRYSQLFYLLGHGMIDRAHFLELMPARELAALVAHPPRVVVDVYGKGQILDALPELAAALRGGAYRLVGRWGALRIFVRPE